MRGVVRRFTSAIPLLCSLNGLLLAISAVGATDKLGSRRCDSRCGCALNRARKNSVVYQAAVTDARVAHEDKKQAVAALLPSVNYNNSAIYTEGNRRRRPGEIHRQQRGARVHQPGQCSRSTGRSRLRGSSPRSRKVAAAAKRTRRDRFARVWS